MPKTTVTYNLLISCPSDVEEEISIIKEVVDNFNKLYGTANNITINARHWSTDAYPESGGKPQALLNKQFINDCDLAVAVFWTRFGTPTDKYQSGSEEEIEEMIKSGKQVFLYFSDKQISPSLLNSEQYEKVKAFREKYKNEGIYWTFSDNQKFKALFLDHLILHFMKEVKRIETPIAQRPNLTLNGVYNNRPADILCTSKCDWKESKYIMDKEEEIRSYYYRISDMKINDVSFLPPKYEDEKVEVYKREYIESFAKKHNIEISDSFFYLGNLYEKPRRWPRNWSLTIEGTYEEKEKHDLINKLLNELDNYKEACKYLESIYSKTIIELVVSNIGPLYDEDINVQIMIKKGYLIKHTELPEPGYGVAVDFNKKSLADTLFKIKKGIYIEEYLDYKEVDYSLDKEADYSNEDDFDFLSAPTEEQRDYIRKLEEIFCYEYFDLKDQDVLSFNISYLKRDKSMAIPSLLFFKNNPNKIQYLIKSKHCPSIISGELHIQE